MAHVYVGERIRSGSQCGFLNRVVNCITAGGVHCAAQAQKPIGGLYLLKEAANVAPRQESSSVPSTMGTSKQYVFVVCVRYREHCSNRNWCIFDGRKRLGRALVGGCASASLRQDQCTDPDGRPIELAGSGIGRHPHSENPDLR